MLGNKRVTNQPIKLFKNRLIGAIAHVFFLIIAMYGFGQAMSFFVDRLGYTQFYQSTLGSDVEQHRAQSRLFDLNSAENDVSESVLLVGEPGFYTELMKTIEAQQCAFKAVVLEIPDYSFKDMRYRPRSKHIAYKGLEVKSLVFQNTSFLWTALATHSTQSTYDLWTLHSKNTSKTLDLKKINLFFKYIQIYIDFYFSQAEPPKIKELKKVYDFQSEKFERVFKQNHSRINFLLDENHADYMTDKGKRDFDAYFEHNEKDLKHRNWRKEGVIMQILGCADAS